MNRMTLIPAMLAAVFTTVFALSACAPRTTYVDLYGQPVPSTGVGRTIVITPATKYVNVEGGETVNFIVGDRQFAWSFNVARTVHSFDLNEVAPPGILSRTVRAYVSPDPKYINALSGPDD